VSPETYDQAVTSAMRARADVADWFGDCDVILTLAALDTAPRSLDSTGDPVCNRVWTLLGVPCLALPAYLAADGLPIGVQLVGRPGREGLLLAAAAFIEDVLAYPRNGLLR
jgi:Asp-tRNA(Asn)/Glu-tRNA(Gln) amidotransferase A subunit family amidase